MNAIYTKKIEGLLARTRPRLIVTRSVVLKSVFGAVAAYLDGRIFISCGKFGMALRLPPATVRRLLDDGDARPLRYFRNGHVKKDYVVLRARVLADQDLSKRLVDASIRFARR